MCPHFRWALRVVGFEALVFFWFSPFLSNPVLDCMALWMEIQFSYKAFMWKDGRLCYFWCGAFSCTNPRFCLGSAFPFLIHSWTSNCYQSLLPLTNSLPLVVFVSIGHGSVRSSVAENTNTWLVHCLVCFLGLHCRDHYTAWDKYSSRCLGNVQIPVQNFPHAVKSLCTHWSLYAYQYAA